MRIRILALAVAMALGLGGAAVSVEPDKSPPKMSEAKMQAADLRAQQSMALSARSMLMPTYLQLIIGIGGMLGLFATLYYTRQSLQLTRESLALTRNEVAAQNEASQRQLRAYVGVKLVNFTGLDGGVDAAAFILVQNKGATPAQGTDVFTYWYIADSCDEPGNYQGFSGPYTLGAGDDTNIRIPFDCRLNSEDLKGVAMNGTDDASSTRFLVVGALIKYNDVFGSPRETRIGWNVRRNGAVTLVPKLCSNS